jgi:ketosteroid isomerase-like protein
MSKVNLQKSFLEAFNKHDLDLIMTFFVDDCVLEMPRGPHPHGLRAEGKANVRATLATRFEGIPNVHYGEDVHWSDGDRGCSEWTLTGTTRAGENIRVRGCDLLTFRGDKIVVKNSFWKIVERP